MPSKQRKRAVETFDFVDDVDTAVMTEVQRDPRIRIAALARRVGLSPPAAADRLRRLESSGVLSYRAEINPRALGYGVLAIVRVSPHGRDCREIPEIALHVPEITECCRITGEDCYFMKVYLRSIDDLEPILDRFARHGRTKTSIVHPASIATRPLRPAKRAK